MLTETEKVRNLVYTYTEKVDSADFAAIGELFADGAVECFLNGVSNGGRCCGSEEVIRWYKASLAVHEGGPQTHHVITNLIVEMNSDEMTAATRSYFMVLQCLPDFHLQIIAAGRYHDRFKKVNGIWRFVEKSIHGDFLGDVTRHYPPLLKSPGGHRPFDQMPLIEKQTPS